MNLSAGLVAQVPPAVVTVTFTVPVPAGDVAVMEVELTTVKVAVAVPKCTAVAPVKAVPVTVTEVPPVVGPEVGSIALTVGRVAAAAGVTAIALSQAQMTNEMVAAPSKTLCRRPRERDLTSSRMAPGTLHRCPSPIPFATCTPNPRRRTFS